MTIIDLKLVKKYVVLDGVIRISERDIPFDTTYEIISPKTGVQKQFRFECSTGSEFDPKTEWIYKSEDGFEFRVCNDKSMCEKNAISYLTRKVNSL